jgi:hypothetical protein
MSPTEKLRVLLIRDILCFGAITAYFFIPGDWKYFTVVVLAIVLRVAGKKLKGSPPLETRQRQIYFAVTISFFFVWILLVLRWIIWHVSVPAIAMGSLAVIVLVAFCLYMYESILRHPTV